MLFLWQALGLTGVVWALTAGISYVLEEKTRLTIRDRTTAIWMNFSESDPLIIVRTPLTFLSALLDAVYGGKVFGWKGFWRSCIVSTGLLVAVLLAGALFHGPFEVTTPPWKAFADSFDAINQFCENPATFANQTADQQAATRSLCTTISSYNTAKCKLLYTISFTALIIVLNWLMDFVCLGISRALLRDMVEVRGFLSLFALHVMNFIVLAFALSICLTLAVVAAAPFTWGVVALIGAIFQFSKVLAVCIAVPGICCAIWFSPMWIRALAVIAALPSVLLLCVTVIALVATPWRVQVHKSVALILDKVALREKAVIAIAVSIGIGLLTVLTFIPSWF